MIQTPGKRITAYIYVAMSCFVSNQYLQYIADKEYNLQDI